MVTSQILILVVLIFLSAFFSGIETALMSISRIKVHSLLKQGRKGAEALYRIKQNSHKLIITILIGNNLVNIGAASFATVIFTNLFGSSGIGIATGVMTFLILVFGEITPKTFAAQNAERVSLLVARPIELLSILLSPIVFILEIISKLMTKILGGTEKKQLSEEELKAIVTMGAEEGLLDEEAAKMMKNIIKFEGKKVTEIMTPKVNVEMVESSLTLGDIINKIIKSPFSRFPVYHKKEDNVIGIIDVDDTIKHLKNNNLKITARALSRKPFFVPDTKEIDDLLNEFEGKKEPIAIVVNEYGDVSGIVTIEDVLEEIVGDIFDKSDREHAYIKRVDKKIVRADAKISVEQLNKDLHLGIEEGKFTTIAGFIEHKLQRIPKKGEKVEIKNVTIEVIKVSKRGIETVRIIKK